MKLYEINNKKEYSFSCIYMFINLVNNKKYIGQTQNCYLRVKQYLRGNDKNRLIGQALNKYGLDNFDFVILEKNVKITDLDKLEQYWMDYYESYNLEKGYNLCREASTTRGYKHSLTSKKKMSDIAKQRYIDHPEYKKFGSDNPMYNKKVNESTKEKISKGLKGNKNAKGKTWNMSLESRQKISAALKGNKNCLGRKISENMRNKIIESNHNRIISDETRVKMSNSHKGKTAKKVRCVELNLEFDMVQDAAKFVNKDGSAISACCRGKQKTCGGYHWEYIK